MEITRYSKRAIWVHWTSALLLLVTIPTGLAMSETKADATKLVLYQFHIAIGLLVFLIAIFHIYIYFQEERPVPIDLGNKIQNQFVRILHRVLTLLIIVLTITGLGSIFTTQIWEAVVANEYQQLSKEYNSLIVTMHHIQGMLFLFLVVLHIGGVVLHRIQKDPQVLERMGLKI